MSLTQTDLSIPLSGTSHSSHHLWRTVQRSGAFATHFFPFFDAFTMNCSVPETISILGFIYFSFQLLCVGFWAQGDKFWDGDDWAQGLHRAAFWAPFAKTDPSSYTTASIIYLVTAAVAVFIIAFHVRYFANARRLIEETLTISMIYLDVITNLCLIPCLRLAGRFVIILNQGNHDRLSHSLNSQRSFPRNLFCDLEAIFLSLGFPTQFDYVQSQRESLHLSLPWNTNFCDAYYNIFILPSLDTRFPRNCPRPVYFVYFLVTRTRSLR
jgi:hypothetical protein